MAFDFSYPNLSSDERGWGAGFPNCQEDKLVSLRAAHVSFGRCRAEVHALLVMLIEETADRGYPPKGGQVGCFNCRCSHASDGSCAEDSKGNEIPSNHSWGLAVDYNTLENVFGAAAGNSVINTEQRWMVRLWRTYGFRWLGSTEIHDWQHFDFAGDPQDAKNMTQKAREDGIGMALTDEQRQTLKEAKRFLDEVRSEMGLLKDKTRPASPTGAARRVARSVLRSEAAASADDDGDEPESFQ